MKRKLSSYPKISVICPVYNASSTIRKTLESAINQTYPGFIEISCYDDGSKDNSLSIIQELKKELGNDESRDIKVTTPSDLGLPHVPNGPGFARNRSVEQSTGEFLVCMDSDDINLPNRVFEQYNLLLSLSSEEQEITLVGSGFTRTPETATPTYTLWANSLSGAALYYQRYRECTLIQPTWFMHKKVWEKNGGWDEVSPLMQAASASLDDAVRRPPILGKPAMRKRVLASDLNQDNDRPDIFPEDTYFLLRHVANGGKLAKVSAPMISYTYSSSSQTWRTSRELLLETRVALWEEEQVWRSTDSVWKDGFLIWNAGRDGKAFYRALSAPARKFVIGFLDIDPKKVYKLLQEKPIFHMQDAFPDRETNVLDEKILNSPKQWKKYVDYHEVFKKLTSYPVVCCVNMEYGGKPLLEFAEKLKRTEGTNFWYFV
jgi:glycosyltransferase involved in cell wall biosynthesis